MAYRNVFVYMNVKFFNREKEEGRTLRLRISMSKDGCGLLNPPLKSIPKK